VIRIDQNKKTKYNELNMHYVNYIYVDTSKRHINSK